MHVRVAKAEWGMWAPNFVHTSTYQLTVAGHYQIDCYECQNKLENWSSEWDEKGYSL